MLSKNSDIDFKKKTMYNLKKEMKTMTRDEFLKNRFAEERKNIPLTIWSFTKSLLLRK